MSELKRQFNFSGAVFFTALGQFGVNFFLSQSLTVNEYGLFSILTSVVGVLVSLFLFGQATAISVSFFSEEKSDHPGVYYELQKSLKIILTSSLFFGFISYLAFVVFTEDQTSFNLIYLLLAACFFYSYQLLFLSLVQNLDHHYDYLKATFSGACSLLVIIYFIPTLQGYFYGLIISSILIVTIARRSIFNKLLVSKNSPINIFSTKKLLFFGSAAVPGMIIASASMLADKYLIGHFLTLVDVGVYSLAFMLSVGIGRVFAQGILRANSITFLGYLQKNNQNDVNNMILAVEKILIYSLALISCAYFIFGKEVFVIIFGLDYLGSFNILLPLFAAVMIEGMVIFLSQILIQRKKLYLLVTTSLGIFIILLALNILFIPQFGIQGAVMVFCLTQLISFLLIFYLAKKEQDFISLPWRLPIFAFTVFIYYLLINL